MKIVVKLVGKELRSTMVTQRRFREKVMMIEKNNCGSANRAAVIFCGIGN
jgi:hypothetical protein